jgi:hypothetical protein
MINVKVTLSAAERILIMFGMKIDETLEIGEGKCRGWKGEGLKSL